MIFLQRKIGFNGCPYVRLSVLAAIFLACSLSAAAQKKRISLKDSLDQKFDLSDYIIDANGFVPVPYIITEPALGGFGIAIVPVFIKKRPPYIDSIKGEVVKTGVAPDITGGIGLYTANETWATMGFRSGTFIKSRIKYLVGGGYGNINMSFYKTFESLGEKELKFNIEVIPALVQAIKRLGYSRWYAGFRYVFLNTGLKYTGDAALAHLTDSFDFHRTISQLGAIIELDKRDNVFTPDRGLKLHFDAVRSDDAIGSDVDFWKLNYYGYGYYPFLQNLIGGLRIDGQQAIGEIPFYLLPFINMRGVPTVRYQGKTTILSEMEMRWDIKRRWSLVGFGGSGKAFDYWDQFKDADWVLTYGTGFRYLLARKFKLRVGIDVAHGSGSWAYYIVFGTNWLK